MAVERRRDLALGLLAAVPHVIHGPDPMGPTRWPGNLAIGFPGVDSSRLMSALPGVAFSSGAACSSSAGRPSHVLAALGLPPESVRATVRLGWTAMLPEPALADGIGQLVTAVQRLQRRAA
jgi:cysteine desulfurase